MIYLGNKSRQREAAPPMSAERLKALFNYDAETGVFTRRVRTAQRSRAGQSAGTANARGCVRISIDSRLYLAHRLAWLYITGEWPANGIDHKDGNPSNNAFANLRDVTPRINSENQRRARSDNSNGLLGVTNSGAKFRAGIQISGKKLHLGSFDTPNSAHQAYLSAKRRMHEGNTL